MSRNASLRSNDRGRCLSPTRDQRIRWLLHRRIHRASAGSRQPLGHSIRSAPERINLPSVYGVWSWKGRYGNRSHHPDTPLFPPESTPAPKTAGSPSTGMSQSSRMNDECQNQSLGTVSGRLQKSNVDERTQQVIENVRHHPGDPHRARLNGHFLASLAPLREITAGSPTTLMSRSSRMNTECQNQALGAVNLRLPKGNVNERTQEVLENIRHDLLRKKWLRFFNSATPAPRHTTTGDNLAISPL